MADVTITTTGSQIGTSRLLMAATYADESLMKYGDPAAMARGREVMAGCARIGAGHAHSWGTLSTLPGFATKPDQPAPPLPEVSEIAGLMDYTDVDLWMDNILSMGQGYVLVDFRLPGIFRRTPAGATVDEWSDGGRLWTDAIPQYEEHTRLLFTHVFERCPQERYYVPIGHEGKGYQTSRSGKGQDWDFDDHRGSPGMGDMGFCTFYSITARAVLRAAEACGLRRDQIILSGPYPALSSYGKIDVHALPAGHPLCFETWSVAKEGVNAFTEFMGLVDPALIDLITFDGGAQHKDDVPMESDWAGIQKMVDTFRWVRDDAHARPGFEGKPLAWMEYYPSKQPGSHPELGSEYNATLRTMFLMEMVREGCSACFAWVDHKREFYSPTGTPDGGQPMVHSQVLKLFHEHFSDGTPLYTVQVEGEPVQWLCSDTHLLLLNQQERALSVTVDGNEPVELPALSCLLLERQDEGGAAPEPGGRTWVVDVSGTLTVHVSRAPEDG
jgi:hypothetical protein